MRVVKALVPVLYGSQRVSKKNIRPFAGSSLLEIKIEQLKRISGIDEVVVNSDCDEMLEVARECGVTAVSRDPFFASSTVPMNEVWHHLAEVTECDDIIYTNCTNPMVRDESYHSALQKYKNLSSEFDSLTTVDAVQEYLWFENMPVNYNPGVHPRSQDLPVYQALNFAISIIPRDLMIANRSILGKNFFQFEISKIEAIDIDSLDDFLIAEAAYLKLSQEKENGI